MSGMLLSYPQEGLKRSLGAWEDRRVRTTLWVYVYYEQIKHKSVLCTFALGLVLVRQVLCS
jgi:hypothetical protein